MSNTQVVFVDSVSVSTAGHSVLHLVPLRDLSQATFYRVNQKYGAYRVSDSLYLDKKLEREEVNVITLAPMEASTT